MGVPLPIYGSVVAVIGWLDEDEYRAEFESVVIRDARSDEDDESGDDAGSRLLSERTRVLWGTVARAGDGWLQLNSGQRLQRVRIEALDSAPDADARAWLDVMETPYRSASGRVGFTTTTSGPAPTGVALGAGPGFYRVRVHRRPADDEGDVWLVQFWSQPQIRPPRWLLREPGPDGQTSASGWHAGSLGDDVFALVSWSPDGRLTTTLTRLAASLRVEPDVIAAILRNPRTAKLQLQGDPSDPGAYLVLTPELDSESVPPEPVKTSRPRPRGTMRYLSAAAWAQPAPKAADLLPSGPPPRIGYVGTNGIVVPRHGRLAGVGPLPFPYTDSAVEVAGGVIVNGGVMMQTGSRDRRTALVRWDGTVLQLGTNFHTVQINRDATIAAVHELRGGRRPYSGLHLIDLGDGSRRSLALDTNDFQLRITGVTRDTIWFEDRTPPGPMSWTSGDPSPVPAPGPPPTSGWDGPAAAKHWHYPAPEGQRSCHPAHWPPGIVIADRDGQHSHPLPDGALEARRVGPVWEDSDHVILVPGGLDYQGRLLRLDVATGSYETAARDTPARLLVWPWPHRPST